MSQVQRTILDSRDESGTATQESAQGGEAGDGPCDAELLQQLTQRGFAESDASAAMRSTVQGGMHGGGGGGGPRARAIDWLCLNLREERLPDKYRPFAKVRAAPPCTLPPAPLPLHPSPHPLLRRPAPAPRTRTPHLAPAPRTSHPHPAPAPRTSHPHPAPAPRTSHLHPAPAPLSFAR